MFLEKASSTPPHLGRSSYAPERRGGILGGPSFRNSFRNSAFEDVPDNAPVPFEKGKFVC